MAFTVYMLRCTDGTFYTGSTTDLERRLHEHNHLKTGARYTRARRPVTLVYSENFDTWSSALKRECAIKKLKRSEKMAFISSSLSTS